MFLSLCFRPSVSSVRHWLRFQIRQHLLLTLLLGFIMDPYPYVRRVALDGLVGLCKSTVVEDRALVEICCCRAVELFNDVEDCVRRAAFFVIEPCCDGKLGFDDGRVAVLLVLAISVPLSDEQCTCSIPPRIFSYAVTMLGRISHALSDIMDKDTLLAYLSNCSRSTIISSAEFDFKRKGSFLPVEYGLPNNARCEESSSAEMQLQQSNGGSSGIHDQKMEETRKVVQEPVNYELEDHNKVTKSVELILEKVKDIWELIQRRCTSEVLQTLRSWKEELATSTPVSSVAGVLAFTLQYLRIVKLLAKELEGRVGNIQHNLVCGCIIFYIAIFKYSETTSKDMSTLHLPKKPLLFWNRRVGSFIAETRQNH